MPFNPIVKANKTTYTPPIIDSVMINGFESVRLVANMMTVAIKFATIAIMVTIVSGLSNFLINKIAALGIRSVTIMQINVATLTDLDKSVKARFKRKRR